MAIRPESGLTLEEDNRIETMYHWCGKVLDLCDLPIEDYMKPMTVIAISGDTPTPPGPTPSGDTVVYYSFNRIDEAESLNEVSLEDVTDEDGYAFDFKTKISPEWQEEAALFDNVEISEADFNTWTEEYIETAGHYTFKAYIPQEISDNYTTQLFDGFTPFSLNTSGTTIISGKTYAVSFFDKNEGKYRFYDSDVVDDDDFTLTFKMIKK